MIKWCSLCQQFQGEIPPFENKSFTHGICPSCKSIGLIWTPEHQLRIQFLVNLQRRFWEAGRSGDAGKLRALAQEGFAHSIRPIDMLFGFAGPLLVKIGELWAAGQLTVAEEHRFTAACEPLLEAVASQIAWPADGAKEKTPAKPVLLANLQSNEHTLGLRFVAIALASSGIASTIMAPGTPANILLGAAVNGSHSIVGVSVSMPSQAEELQNTIEIFAREPGFKGRIIVGGAAINNGLTLPDAPKMVEFLARPVFDSAECHARWAS